MVSDHEGGRGLILGEQVNHPKHDVGVDMSLVSRTTEVKGTNGMKLNVPRVRAFEHRVEPVTASKYFPQAILYLYTG